MPLPTGTTRGSGLSRSEAAILAWKKRVRAKPKVGGLDPKIAARVKQILAGKQKKGLKGKAKGKPKETRTKQEVANQNRAAVAKQGGMDKLEGVMVRLGAGMNSDLEKGAHDELISKGLATRGADGRPKLTPAGKKWRSAADKGNVEGAGAALAEGRAGASEGAAKEKAKGAKTQARATAKAERVAKQQAKQVERQKKLKQAARKQRKAVAGKQPKQQQNDDAKQTVADAMAKWKRARQIQSIGKAIDMSDELAIKAGARHSKTDMQHLQGIHDSAVACGANCGTSEETEDTDTEDAGKAIKGIMDNPAWYASHECGDIMQACSALQTLGMLIQSELSEGDEDAADVTQLCDAAETLVDFISSELDELRGAAKEGAQAQGYAPMKGIEIAKMDDGEEIATMSGYAVKAIGDAGMVGGYLVKFGGDGDLSQWRDVFTKDTNFGKHTKSDVWVHHRMLPGLGQKQLTNQAEFGMDDEGVFVNHLLDLRKSYEAKLYNMVQAGKLGWSSGTAPHLVDRKALGDGRHEVTQWTLGLDASYTPMPAGGFVVNAGALKAAFLAELGYEAIDTDSPEAVTPDSMRRDGVKMDDERARRLTLELSLMELEETAP